ncbi:pyruvate dehydrogenase complex dihydrolipoamide acetyltransferase component (E2) [Myotisia sp. PD_48]|nr:pyruvate dehydrogenase complex dihydrolipoamide acetyltransferase component (E2) [Myotisia sp. PD_48]
MVSAAVISRSCQPRLLLAKNTFGLRESRTVYRLRDALRSPIPAVASMARYYASKSYPPHTVISMPALSPTMTAGNIGAWHKKAGETLAPGDVLVEIETDKAQMDFEFQEEGVLAKILKDAGEKDVAVGNPIAVMIEEGGDISAFESFTLADAGGEKSSATEKPDNAVEAKQEEKPAPAPTTEQYQPEPEEPESTGEKLQPSLDREPLVSPAARALALEKGVAIGGIKGTGPGGRVTKEDVEKSQPAASGVSAAGPTYEDVPASSMRKVIASRLAQSVKENPHYFVSSTLSVSRLLKLRQALNETAEGRYKLSVNDFLVKACAYALKKVPAVNSRWLEQNGQVMIRHHKNVDISVAVATPSGLITPIVKGADGLGLSAISNQIKDLGKRAKENKLKPEEFNGGTFTISNMGMNPAVERFTAVINPPQSAILAVGTTRKVAIPQETEDGTAVQWDDQIVVTASFDHKVIDGAVGAEFMRELKKVIENPLELLL